MIAEDGGDVAAQLTGAVSQQKVVEAMIVAGNEDRNALGLMRISQTPGHLKSPSGLLNRAFEGYAVGVHFAHVKPDALEKLLRDRIRVLVGIKNIGAMPVEHLRQRGDDATPVGARDQQRSDVIQ
jgi:hypothetical protein